ncbi:FecCD family ABC transporter permease [Enterococcus rivorum]|uniref:ABC transporter permease n=1 Tax=Enterococcus rivorum TaxID=762845 RepID=A0A1E5KTL9_9ENTE|nr:iron ABC transporter permease [Enterococcus rivorum]MBP2097937.1 iron complex transport system permease protein [Enterococcus rivorum]OEH81210.1 ABC transporter permease [Enterococcus rivorum]
MKKTQKTNNKQRGIILGIVAMFLVVFTISFFLGKFPIPIPDFFQTIFNKIFLTKQSVDTQVETILFKIRFPRIIMAVVIGAGISVSGSTYQALFQNPMVSQDILGASQGAAFGAALGLFLSFNYERVILFSFIFGLLAVGLVLLINRYLRIGSILNLILIGMMVGSLFSSAVSFLKLVGDPTNTLPAITYWLMGSLSSIKIQDVYFAAPLILVGMLPIILFRWRLNILSLGEEEANSLGVDVGRLRIIFILAATLITATAVSISGLIGWVGLIVPHFSRMLVGNDHRVGIPVTAILGGTFLLLVDDISRVLTTSEIPIGILTSFIGAPIFLFLIVKENQAKQAD